MDSVKSPICPVAMMDANPEIRQLIDLQAQYESAGQSIFGKNVPSWAVDFGKLVGDAKAMTEAAGSEKADSIS